MSELEISNDKTVKNASVKKITKFNELPKIKNGLYIFDIDETILVFEELSDQWWNRNFEEIYSQTNDVKHTNNIMEKMFTDVVTTNKPMPTDLEGFHAIEKSLYDNNSKVVFLTARPESMKGVTYRQIANLPVCYSYTIYFSAEKGESVKWLLDRNISDTFYESVIFVDDKIYNIESVQSMCPGVQCFQFIPDEYITKLTKSETMIASNLNESK
jgi:hypothetical protein